MTRTASTPVAPPRARPQRLAQQRLAQQRARQQRMRQLAVLGLPQLLDDKLRVPALTLPVLRRRRVTELVESAAARRVTLVSGPAGAGKTVACASWAADRPAARQPAWLTVDTADREPARFWQYVLAALVHAGAIAPHDAKQLAAAPPEACPTRIVAAVRKLPDPVVLVIDDVHELANSGALAGLDVLIKHAPAGLRLVLSGRCPPGLALARLRVAGELADIGAADLACTAQEADAYYAMLGMGMPPARRAELLNRTEGWMAGLRLAAMGPEPGPVGDYVCDEVLGQQPPEVRRFLLRTSVAASVCGDLADALTGEGGTGARTLERLSQENSLVEPVGPGSAEYRYHPMLREVLAAELRRELPGEVSALFGRAARWHATRGAVLDAVRAAAEAGDWEFAGQVLAEAGPAALVPAVPGPAGPASTGPTSTVPVSTGPTSTVHVPAVSGQPGLRADGPAELEAVLAVFPAERRAGDSRVAAALAAARLWQGDPDGAVPHLDCARRSLAGLDHNGRRLAAPWLTALQVMRAASRVGDGPDWLAREWSQAEQAEAAASTVGEYRAAGLLWFALGCARLRRWEIRDASHALGRASAQLAAGSLPGLRARAIAWQSLAVARYGDLAVATRMVAEVADSPAGQAPDVACPLALATAQVSLLRDELDAARRKLDEADGLTGSWLAGEPRADVVSGVIGVDCAIAEVDTARARGMVMRLREASPAGDPEFAAMLTMLDADIALAAGDRELSALVLGLASGPGGPGQEDRPERADVQVCRARLLLATGDDKGALEAVQPLLDGSAPGATSADRVTALLVAGVARRRLSQAAEAAELIEQALVLAEPDGAYRVFLDGGPAVRSAMTVLVPPTSRCAGFAGRVLERFDGQLARPAGPADQADLPLTGSELAVLRFLPSHMTNQEIAEALFLSINTVKTHLRSAYRKLGVANRRQAIARGRRLDLL